MTTFSRTRYLCHALTAAVASQVSTVSTLGQKNLSCVFPLRISGLHPMWRNKKTTKFGGLKTSSIVGREEEEGLTLCVLTAKIF
jgi:hypothetical protein